MVEHKLVHTVWLRSTVGEMGVSEEAIPGVEWNPKPDVSLYIIDNCWDKNSSPLSVWSSVSLSNPHNDSWIFWVGKQLVLKAWLESMNARNESFSHLTSVWSNYRRSGTGLGIKGSPLVVCVPGLLEALAALAICWLSLLPQSWIHGRTRLINGLLWSILSQIFFLVYSISLWCLLILNLALHQMCQSILLPMSPGQTLSLEIMQFVE